jgi:hypothetical protein
MALEISTRRELPLEVDDCWKYGIQRQSHTGWAIGGILGMAGELGGEGGLVFFFDMMFDTEKWLSSPHS